ncbi:hypothetical protein [Paludibaculum fermentans]|uniref:Uncharacterized protein n=1 Tax=Paludibaculum fermentans TaxID=1473598 RepID=A0A7S7NXA7_PALFE|nr:hypothetical protein [Paludibaculum fermentans]QOY91485.1 hypothetical protein IRI77_16505 [Paludibaculum fermentans]
MVQIRQRFLARNLPLLVLAAAACVAPASGQKPRFYPDDPIARVPKPVPVKSVETLDPNDLYDFFYQSLREPVLKIGPSQAINTLGEVPDSDWFTNRHSLGHRLSLEALKRGPGDSSAPQPPFLVVGAKTDGITPGFRMTDAKGRLYFVKPDPRTNPEMATAADVLGAHFFYALGYNTPENYIVNIKDEELSISPKAKVTGVNGKPRPMTQRDIDRLKFKMARRADGSRRVIASLATPGKPVGPFSYEGIRSDDPNDLVPHETRRDLRGMAVFCAWLNHTDAKGRNSLDVLAGPEGAQRIRHFLIDFGSILGSDSDMPKDARNGNAFIIPTGRNALKKMGQLGFAPEPWETAAYPHQPAIGRLESKVFDPLKWASNYPNPAFVQMQPDDAYWAAKRVMAFSDEDIRTIVETGQYSDSSVVDYITKTLAERRDRIGRVYFTKVLALEQFSVDGGVLKFEDLAVKFNFVQPRQYDTAWFSFDNATGAMTPAAGLDQVGSAYAAARIAMRGDSTKSVTVYIRRNSGAIVGIERVW